MTKEQENLMKALEAVNEEIFANRKPGVSGVSVVVKCSECSLPMHYEWVSPGEKVSTCYCDSCVDGWGR